MVGWGWGLERSWREKTGECETDPGLGRVRWWGLLAIVVSRRWLGMGWRAPICGPGSGMGGWATETPRDRVLRQSVPQSRAQCTLR